MSDETAVGVLELAVMLNTSPDTVYRLARKGTLPGFKLGGVWRFFPSKVLASLEPTRDTWAQPARSIRARRAA